MFAIGSPDVIGTSPSGTSLAPRSRGGPDDGASKSAMCPPFVQGTDGGDASWRLGLARNWSNEVMRSVAAIASYRTSLSSLPTDSTASTPATTVVGAPRPKMIARESTNTLKTWLFEHIRNPYPSKGEKIMLAIMTRMTLTQVSTWFANARRRLKKENRIDWHDDDDDDDEDRADDDDAADGGDDDADDEGDNEDAADDGDRVVDVVAAADDDERRDEDACSARSEIRRQMGDAATSCRRNSDVVDLSGYSSGHSLAPTTRSADRDFNPAFISPTDIPHRLPLSPFALSPSNPWLMLAGCFQVPPIRPSASDPGSCHLLDLSPHQASRDRSSNNSSRSSISSGGDSNVSAAAAAGRSVSPSGGRRSNNRSPEHRARVIGSNECRTGGERPKIWSIVELVQSRDNNNNNNNNWAEFNRCGRQSHSSPGMVGDT